MKDYLGNKLSRGDIIMYANNAGLLTLAVILDISVDRLHVSKRGYRDAEIDRELLIPTNTLRVTEQVFALDDLSDTFSEADVKFVKEHWVHSD